MISTDGLIDFLRTSRQEKLAATLILGLMYDSPAESVARLEMLLPTMKEIKEGSRKFRGKQQINVDHDVAKLAYDLVDDLLPWLRRVAELFDPPLEPIQGLA